MQKNAKKICGVAMVLFPMTSSLNKILFESFTFVRYFRENTPRMLFPVFPPVIPIEEASYVVPKFIPSNDFNLNLVLREECFF